MVALAHNACTSIRMVSSRRVMSHRAMARSTSLRDLTPVGKRHTPVDKGEPVKVDPKAAAAHELAQQESTCQGAAVRDPESD